MLQGFFFLGTERCGRRSWAVYVQISGCPCLDYSIMTASLLALPQWCQTRFMMPKSNSRNFIFIVSFLSAKGPELAKLMPNYLPPLAHTSPYTSGKKLLPQRRSALRFMTCPNIVRRSLDRFYGLSTKLKLWCQCCLVSSFPLGQFRGFSMPRL